MLFKLFFSVFFLLSIQFFSGQKILLVNQGKTDYQIVVSKTRTDAEWNAAFLLKEYIDKVAGVSIPVVYDDEPVRIKEIVVGNTNRKIKSKTLNSEEDFVTIKTEGEKLLISGGSRKGALYAAATFLENYLGVRKYTKDFEVVPYTKTIELPASINYAYTPTFQFRTTYFEDSLNLNYADWHKLNYFFEDRVNFAHSFGQYLPDTLFKTHPEYFALINGKRTLLQPCLSHPEVYKIMKQNLLKEMAKHPNQNYFQTMVLAMCQTNSKPI